MVKHPTDELRTLNGFFVKSCVSPTVQCTQYQYGSNFYSASIQCLAAIKSFQGPAQEDFLEFVHFYILKLDILHTAWNSDQDNCHKITCCACSMMEIQCDWNRGTAQALELSQLKRCRSFYCILLTRCFFFLAYHFLCLAFQTDANL